MPDDDRLVEELVFEIRTYLDAHPHAADTLDGIVQWWIVHQRFLRGIEAAGKALDRLVADGQMEIARTPDGRVLYRAARNPQGDDASSPPSGADPDLGEPQPGDEPGAD
jgi:hypothetical protein